MMSWQASQKLAVSISNCKPKAKNFVISLSCSLVCISNNGWKQKMWVGLEMRLNPVQNSY